MEITESVNYNTIIDQAAGVLKKMGLPITEVYLYGSRARTKDSRRDADIDILVTTDDTGLLSDYFTTLEKINLQLEGEGVRVGDGPGEVSVLIAQKRELDDPTSSSDPSLFESIKRDAIKL